MRVGLVCPYSLDVAGGVQQQVLGLASCLIHRGHHAQVLAPGRGQDQPDHVTTTGRDVPVRWNGSVARVHWSRRAGRTTRDWLAEGRFDVVHVHEPLAPGLGWHAVLGAVAPVVGTAHTAQEHARALRVGATTALRRVGAGVDVWTAVSQDAAATLASYCGVPPLLIPNGLSVDSFAQGWEARSDGNEVRVLFLGRLGEPRKGLPVALRAFADVAARRDDVVLEVAGPGHFARTLAALRPALAPAVRSRIRFLGPVDLPIKAALLQRADVVVAPQLGGESFGIVVAEAMAAGAAVLASDLPAFRRLLGDGRHGVIVPRGDVAAWAQALDALVVDPHRRADLGRAARSAVDDLDWKRVTDSVLAVYAQALR